MATTEAEKKSKMTLDEAMLEAGAGTFNIVIMLLSGLVLMGMIMETMGLSYIIPAAHCDLQLTQTQKGWLAAIPFIGIIVTSHLWGWMADTRGRRYVMIYSMTLSSIFSVVSSFSPDLYTFATVRFVASLFASGPSAVCYAYLGEFNTRQHRDRMVAFGAAFVGIGTVVLPAVSWMILPLDMDIPLIGMDIHFRPWRLLVIAFAVPYAIGALAMFFAPESPKFLYAVGRLDEALAVVKRIYAVNNLMPAESFPVKELVEIETRNADSGSLFKSMKKQTIPLFRKPLLPFTLLACFVQFGIFATANGFYIWFPTILNKIANHAACNREPNTICEVLSRNVQLMTNATDYSVGTLCDDSVNTVTYLKAMMIGTVFCSMYVLVGILVDFIGKRTILITLLGFSGACGIATEFVRNENMAIILFGVFQMCGACIGLLTAVVVQIFPTHLRAMAISLSMMSGRVGSVFGSNLIGWLIEMQCSISFYLFGSLLMICGILCVIIPEKRTRVIRVRVVNPARQPRPTAQASSA